MKLISFVRGGRNTFGCVEGGLALDFAACNSVRSTLRECLPLGLAYLQSLAAQVAPEDKVVLSSIRLRAPIPDAPKYLGLGGNYASHAAEAEKAGLHRSQAQTWFNKQVSCINGPYDPIELPFVSSMLDYEGELGVVIAHDCRHVTAADAWSVIAGYVVCNDVSVRDWQLRSPTHTLGKSFDTHGPFGPWIVTPDELPDPHALMLRTWVNGELRQQANTAEMIFRIPALIEELSTAFTLQAGDVLSTGTPAGVGGLFDPPRYMRAGDVVRVEIEGVGHIENVVINEPRRSA
jgi:2-keto-4-pentenoate hydratase/2-oxohepta-3-ene-1,7-dioic acid hydratase in catechol pathway